MTDIVKRLRKRDGSMRLTFRSDGTCINELGEEAAAEIERLRAALVMAREALPRRDSLPNTKTRIGDIIDAVDAAIATQAPGDSRE